MIRRGVLCALLLALSIPALAEAPTRSLIPPARPGTVAASQQTAPPPAASDAQAEPRPQADPVAQLLTNIFRPKPRPGQRQAQTTEVIQMTAAGSAPSALAVPRSVRPAPRPDNLQRRNTVIRTGMAASGNDARRTTAAGSVCGVPEIKGVALQSIPGKVSGCGQENPVKVTSVSGITLSQPITVDCQTAVTFNAWVKGALIPLTDRMGGGVKSINIMASYACRPRNNQSGAKISEHGKGHAVDFGGFTLANGVEISVLKHWSDPTHGPLMQKLHKAACGPFGTVLGPKSDRYHQNHFHFDTARYRSGAYCR